MNRACECCPMLDAGYHLEYYLHMNGNHLGHYKVRYSHPISRNKFSLAQQYLCSDCKVAGRQKMVFSALQPNVLIIPATPMDSKHVDDVDKQ